MIQKSSSCITLLLSSVHVCAFICPTVQLQASVLTYCAEYRPNLDDTTHSAGMKIHVFNGTQKFSAVFTGVDLSQASASFSLVAASALT